MAGPKNTANNYTDQYTKTKAKSDAAKKAKSDAHAITAYKDQIGLLTQDIKSATTAMADPQSQLAQLQKDLKLLLDDGHGHTLPPPWSPSITSQYETNKRDQQTYINQINGYQTRIDRDNKQIADYQKKIAALTKPTQNSGNTQTKGGGGGGGGGATSTDTGGFKYNAPMVSTAYFNSLAGADNIRTNYEANPSFKKGRGGVPVAYHKAQTVDGLYHFVDIGNFTDAKQAWSINSNGQIAGGKGSFQMDRVVNTAAAIATAQKAYAKAHPNDASKFDKRMYGFKFLYNPTSIDMSWGAILGANPVFESMGQDPAVPLAANLLSSTLSFDIVLNRIQDFEVIESPGILRPYNKYPYPSPVDPADIKEIYEKGTMYDIEYLFKTMHGFDGFTNYQSSLMQNTNDPGWLPVRPVELHLGNKLRYRVRITGMSVKHSIFNSRMVPILSTVSFTCARYWDGPTTPASTKKK